MIFFSFVIFLSWSIDLQSQNKSFQFEKSSTELQKEQNEFSSSFILLYELYLMKITKWAQFFIYFIKWTLLNENNCYTILLQNTVTEYYMLKEIRKHSEYWTLRSPWYIAIFDLLREKNCLPSKNSIHVSFQTIFNLALPTRRTKYWLVRISNFRYAWPCPTNISNLKH